MLDHGAWALKLHTLSHALYCARHPRAARAIWKLTRILTGVDIYPSATVGTGLNLPHPNGIVIGQNVRIGSSVTILQQVTVGAHTIDGIYNESNMPNICDRVMLGAGCKVLGGVTIGEGAVIGANAVVLKDLPPHCTAVGIPARVTSLCERKAKE